MDYNDILKILTNANPNPDKTSLISALSSGGDMSALLPFLLKSTDTSSAGVSVSEEGKKAELPADDEIKEALLKFNETQNKE